jgi:hypothetical protein
MTVSFIGVQEKDNLTFDPLPWLNNFPFDISSCECYDNTKNMLYTVKNAYELKYSREIVRIRIQCHTIYTQYLNSYVICLAF